MRACVRARARASVCVHEHVCVFACVRACDSMSICVSVCVCCARALIKPGRRLASPCVVRARARFAAQRHEDVAGRRFFAARGGVPAGVHRPLAALPGKPALRAPALHEIWGRASPTVLAPASVSLLPCPFLRVTCCLLSARNFI